MKTDFYRSAKGSVVTLTLAVVLIALLVSTGSAVAQSAADVTAATNSLIEAVNKRDLAAVKRSIARGADVNAEIDLDLTAVDLAIDKGYFQIAHYLLAARKQQEVDQAKAQQPQAQAISPFASVQPALALQPVPAPVTSVVAAPMPIKASAQPAVSAQISVAPKVKIAEPDPYNPIPSTVVATKSPILSTMPAVVASVQGSQGSVSPQTPNALGSQPTASKLGDSSSFAETISSALDSVTGIFKPEAKPVAKVDVEAIKNPVNKPAIKKISPVAPITKTKPVAVTPTSVAYDSNQQKPGAVRGEANAFDVVKNEVGSMFNSVTDLFAPKAKLQPQAPTPNPVIGKVASGAVKPVSVNPQAQVAATAINPEPAKLPTPSRAYQTATVATINPQLANKSEQSKQQASLFVIPDVPRQINVPLALGKTVRLERTLKQEAIKQNNCFQRRNGGSHFCVEETDWSGALAEKMDISTIMYRGTKSVVRYDEGIASRYYSLFPSQHFEDVARSLVNRYGSPDGRDIRPMALIGKAPLTNITLTWKIQSPQTGQTEVLEIRKYDNERGMMPDTDYGFVRLFRKGSVPIFDQISEMDFIINR